MNIRIADPDGDIIETDTIEGELVVLIRDAQEQTYGGAVRLTPAMVAELVVSMVAWLGKHGGS